MVKMPLQSRRSIIRRKQSSRGIISKTKCMVISLSLVLLLYCMASIFFIVQHHYRLNQRKQVAIRQLEKAGIIPTKRPTLPPMGRLDADGGNNNNVHPELLAQVRKHLSPNSTVESCRSVTCSLEKENHEHDDDYITNIVAYNSLARSRWICGHKVEGDSILILPLDCNQQQKRVFQEEPTVSGPIHIEPISLSQNPQWHNDASFVTKDLPCNVPCQHAGSLINGEVYIHDTPFVFHSSMESSLYYPANIIQYRRWTRNQYYATTSRKSEIPLPYFDIKDYGTLKQNPPVDFKSAIKGASFIAKNCNSKSGREAIVSRLMNQSSSLSSLSSIRVDSLSHCLHNAELPPGITNTKSKIQLMRAYLFHLAFENSKEDDYITEKVFQALSAGTVPVYMGAGNAHDLLPPNSVIFYNHNVTALGEYLYQVANDEELYNSYHAWRRQEEEESLESKLFIKQWNYTQTHSHCRWCRWTYAKERGFLWNHESQDFYNVAVWERKICIHTSNDFIMYPFIEEGKAGYSNNNKVLSMMKSDCEGISGIHESRVADGGSSWRRSVELRDGAVDISLIPEKTSGSTSLSSSPYTLTFPWNTSECTTKQVDEKQILLDMKDARITIVANVEISCLLHDDDETITLSLALLSNKFIMTKLRIIVEAHDIFHRGSQDFPYYHGELMVNDFRNPLELFKVVVRKSPTAV